MSHHSIPFPPLPHDDKRLNIIYIYYIYLQEVEEIVEEYVRKMNKTKG